MHESARNTKERILSIGEDNPVRLKGYDNLEGSAVELILLGTEPLKDKSGKLSRNYHAKSVTNSHYYHDKNVFLCQF
jgi:hypothetical protein